MRRRTRWVALVAAAGVLIPAGTLAAPAGAGRLASAARPPADAARPILLIGAQGPAVRDLQLRLRELGSSIAADGRFGPATLRAVMALQAARGLPADGIVGPRTWRAIGGGGPIPPAGNPPITGRQLARPVLRLGDVGRPVADLQRLLAAAGQNVAADGRFGPRTHSAVLAVQQSRRLAADGVVGPATWGTLSSGTAAPLAIALVSSRRAAEPWRTIGARSYAVRAGDTLASVAAATSSTAAALAAANRLAAGSHLPVGATLLVPGGWRCPVPGGGFVNDYGFPRAGHLHEGNDIFAVRGTPVFAPVGGRVVRREGGLGGRAVNLYGDDGNRYYFAHLDSYGAKGKVAAGALIGYVGNSGNAITTLPHLHFEIHPGGGAAVNPFATLTLACKH